MYIVFQYGYFDIVLMFFKKGVLLYMLNKVWVFQIVVVYYFLIFMLNFILKLKFILFKLGVICLYIVVMWGYINVVRVLLFKGVLVDVKIKVSFNCYVL